MGYARWSSGTRRRWDEFFRSPRSIWRLFEGGHPNEDVKEGLPIVGRYEFGNGREQVMTTKTERKRTLLRYDPKVSARAVREVLDEKKSVTDVAKRLAIKPRTLAGWCTDERKRRAAWGEAIPAGSDTPCVVTHPTAHRDDGRPDFYEIIQDLCKVDIDTFFDQDELTQKAISTLRNLAKAKREVR